MCLKEAPGRARPTSWISLSKVRLSKAKILIYLYCRIGNIFSKELVNFSSASFCWNTCDIFSIVLKPPGMQTVLDQVQSDYIILSIIENVASLGAVAVSNIDDNLVYFFTNNILC